MKALRLTGTPLAAYVFAYAAGIFCMAIVDASGKYLSQGYPVAEIIFFRSLLAVAPLVLMVTHQGWASIKTRRPILHALRGVTVLLTLGLFFWSLRYLPLADATALNLTSPMFTTLFAALFLGEVIPRRYWAALFIGVVGIWLVMKPEIAALRVASLLAIASAAAYASTSILTRILVRTDTALCCTFHSNTVMILVLGCGAFIQNWISFTIADCVIVFVMAVASIGLQLLTGFALKHVAASKLAPLDYTLLIWNVSIGAIIWHEWPDLSVWSGMLLVCASCWLVMAGRRTT